MPITFGQAKTRFARSTAGGVASTDPRVAERINEAVERLMQHLVYHGYREVYAFDVTHGQFALPRHLESVMGIRVGSSRRTLRGQFYEFVDGGPGLLDEDTSGWGQVLDRGDAYPTMQLLGEPAAARVYADLVEDEDARILVQGLDADGNRVQTDDSGTYVDGEYISLFGGPNDGSIVFSKITGVVKPVTVGPTRLYSYDSDADEQELLSVYEPGEEVPSYRRYEVPGWTPNEDAPVTITALCRRRFITLTQDTDILPIDDLAAIKNQLLALEAEDKNDLANAQAYEARAVTLLDRRFTKAESGNQDTGNFTVSGLGGGIRSFY